MNRKDFNMTKKWVMFDNSSITFKPKVMIDAIDNFYLNNTVNPHSKDSSLCTIVLEQIKEARVLISKLVNCKYNEVIFTSGTTHSINLIISSLIDVMKKEDEIIIFKDSHASGIIPLLEIRRQKGSKIHFVLDINEFKENMNNKTKIIFFAQINNTNGTEHDMKAIYNYAKSISSKCIIINDIAQAVSHSVVDFKYSDALTFSGGKIYGPSGIGALVLNEKLIDELSPKQFGGGMNIYYDKNGWVPKAGYHKWESGTLNIAGIIGFAAAIKYFLNLGIQNIINYEKEISIYLYNRLKEIKDIIIFSKLESHIILLAIKGINSHDLCSTMGHNNILSRSGTYCANLIKEIIDYDLPTLRLSVALYNNKDDVDKLINFIKNVNILDGII